MMRFVCGACLSFLLIVAAPVSAFFNLDDLKQDFEQAEGNSELSGILKELDDVSGTVRFNDVSSSDWFNKYVSSVAKWGIVSGYSDANGNSTGQFGPANPVTIAEILKMAFKAAQVDESTCGSNPRHRQAADHWARAFVACGEQRGMRLLSSSPDLNRGALRAEVLSVIHDAFGDTIPPLLSTFRDTADHELESDVAYAAAMGIVSGDKDKFGVLTGTFRPDDGVNRAEAAKILYEKLRIEAMGEG